MTESGRPGASTRPRWLLPAVIGGSGALVATAVVGGIVLANQGGSAEPVPVTASTIRLPSPTPSIEPVAREASTPFAKALPTSVLQYALATSQEASGWLEAGALEAYVETFTDGGAGEVIVQSGQFATADEARAHFQALMAELPMAEIAQAATATEDAEKPAPAPTAGRDQLPQTGPVQVGGKRAGTYAAADLGDGTAAVVWFNGTAAFRVVAPLADALDVYRAFPL